MVGPRSAIFSSGKLSSFARVKALRSGDCPVAINLMSDFHITFVITGVFATEGQRSLVAEFVLETAVDGSRGAHEASRCTFFEAIPSLERVLDAIPERLIAAACKNLLFIVSTQPVSSASPALWNVDELRPALFQLHVSELKASADVEFIADLEIKLRHEFDLLLMIVFAVDLNKNGKSTISSVLYDSCRQIDFVRY